MNRTALLIGGGVVALAAIWLLAPKRKPPDIHDPGNADVEFTNLPFQIVFSERKMPDIGAGNWAYESLAIPAFSAIGAATGIGKTFMVTQKPLFQTQTGSVTGAGTYTGQIFHVPLLGSVPGSVH